VFFVWKKKCRETLQYQALQFTFISLKFEQILHPNQGVLLDRAGSILLPTFKACAGAGK
jgi:hypothetical protein